MLIEWLTWLWRLVNELGALQNVLGLITGGAAVWAWLRRRTNIAKEEREEIARERDSWKKRYADTKLALTSAEERIGVLENRLPDHVLERANRELALNNDTAAAADLLGWYRQESQCISATLASLSNMLMAHSVTTDEKIVATYARNMALAAVAINPSCQEASLLIKEIATDDALALLASDSHKNQDLALDVISDVLAAPQTPESALFLAARAKEMVAQNEFITALAILSRAASLADRFFMRQDSRRLSIRSQLGYVNFRLARYKIAEDIYRDLYRITSQELGDNHEFTLMMHYNLAQNIAGQSDRQAEAAAMLESVYKRQCETLGAHHTNTLMTKLSMTNSRSSSILDTPSPDWDAQEAQLKAVISGLLSSSNPDMPMLAIACSTLATHLGRRDRFDEAMALNRQALAAMRYGDAADRVAEAGLSVQQADFMRRLGRFSDCTNEIDRVLLEISDSRLSGDPLIENATLIRRLAAEEYSGPLGLARLGDQLQKSNEIVMGAINRALAAFPRTANSTVEAGQDAGRLELTDR